MPQPTVTFKIYQPFVTNYGPGQGPDAFTPERSFFDIQVTDDSLIPDVWAADGGWFDSWCLNPTLDIGVPTGFPWGGSYTAPIYSSYDILPPALDVGDRTRLDEVNWVLNQSFAANINYGEVQAAIWRLLGFDDSTWNSGYTLQSMEKDGVVDLGDVAGIVAQALTHDGFVPTAWGQTLGAIIDMGSQQPLMVETRLARLGDFVWEDLDADGTQDTDEPGIDGVTVTLLGVDGFGNIVSRNTTTGDNPATGTVEQGYYVFDGLVPGNYNVTFTLPGGFSFTTQLNPANPDGFGDDSDANPGTGQTNNITLGSGESELDVDAGLVRQVNPASLGDRVWLDQDQDGIQDPTEPGVSGVTVELYKCVGGVASGAAVGTTVTDASGNYGFANLVPGEYIVKFVQGAYVLTTQDVNVGGGNDANDSDADPASGFTGCYTLASGENNPTVDAGVLPAAIGDKVFEDKNANGQQDGGEGGIAGATVKLYTCVGGVQGVFVAQTTTDANGNYGFSGLMPGEYIVEFITPGGYTQTLVDVGADGTDSDAGAGGLTGCYLLPSGQTNDTVDAGYYLPAALGDRVWSDTNANGQQDAGEGGVPNVTVELYACVNNQPSGPLLATDVTDADGLYSFTGLRPGDYIVKFITPTGYTLTTANVGADGSDSDAGVGGLTGCYNLESGETDNTADAGLYRAAIDIEKLVRGEYTTGGNGGTEGLTPGFWKTHSEFGPAPLAGWPETGYSPTQSWEAIFGRDVPGTPTLLQALSTGGGGLDALLRHSSAALLNAANPNVDYAYSVAQVISMTQAAITSGSYNATKDLFEVQNEKGADLSTPASSPTTVVTPDFDADLPGSGPQIPVGGKAVFTYVVTNNGLVEIGNVAVSDDRLSGLTFTGGDTDNDGRLDLTETWTYRAEEVVTSSAEISNIGTVTGTGGTILVTDSDAAHYNGSALTQSLGDFIWMDADRDGIQDSGEAGIGGLLVTLTGGGADGLINGIGDTTATTSTDVGGYYQFDGLDANVQYQVMFSKPADTVFTTRDAGANDGVDSDADPATGKSQIVTLTPGQNNPTLDAGVYAATAGIQIVKDAAQSIVAPNTPVTFTYSVSNTGGVALANIAVVDDNATPTYAADDFAPTPVLGAGGKNIGDLDGDNLLDTTEVWKYSASVIPPIDMTVTVEAGAAPIESGQLIYTTLANGDVRVAYLQANNFNDNTYGTGSDAGWTAIGKTHTFGNLTGSDKAGFLLKYSDGSVLAQFYQDYITSSTTNIDGYSSYSNYQSLGFSGGDGSWVAGSTTAQTWLKDFDSTLETNLNQPGSANNGVAYTLMTVNSPVGDAKWDVVNGYSFVISAAAFTGGKSFGGATIFDQHNSPAKVGGSNSYIPDIVGGASVNTATVTGTAGTTTVTDDDDATVIINTGALGSLGDRVWLDLDADGVQDGGEAGIAGVTMVLTGDFDGNGTVDYTATAVTGGDGLYTFGGLPAGQYKVTVDAATLPANLTQTYDLDGLASPDMASGVLAPEQNRVDFDFGYVPSAPGFSLVKTASKSTAAVGEPVTYTYVVGNTGASPLTDVRVRDDNGTPDYAGDDFDVTNRTGGDTDNDNVLDPGEAWTYTATVVPPVGLTSVVNSQTMDSGDLLWSQLPNGDWRVTFLQSRAINDNNYAASGDAPDWNRSHTFSNLTGSDKAGFELKNGSGQVVMKFYMDYITAASTQDPVDGYASYSGYRSLGVTGGDGSISLGSATNLYDFDSSLELNLNRPGYTTTITNSPIGDPNWEYTMAYSFTVKATAFGSAGFGGATLFDQHNSPPKTGEQTFDPSETGGEVTNTAIVTAKFNGNTVVAVDDATVTVGQGGGGGGGPVKFFVVDKGTDSTFKYSATGASVGSFALEGGNTEARDVAANLDGSRLWVLDKDKDVNVYDGGSGSALGTWTASTMGSEPEGISVDGSDLWLAARDRKIYWYDEAASRTAGSDTAEKTFTPSMSGNLKGIVSDGTYLWAVTEGGTDYVYRFTIVRDGGGTPTGLTQSGQWTLPSANGKPTGITLDPSGASQSLWIVDETSDTVYEYGSGRSLTSGTGTVSASFALAATNTSPQGIADPLSFLDAAASDSVDWMFEGLGRADPYAGVADTDWMVSSGVLESVPYVGGVPVNAEPLADFM